MRFRQVETTTATHYVKVVLVICLLLGAAELIIQRSDLGAGIHVYNIVHHALQYVHVDEPCIPSSQHERFDILRGALRDFDQVASEVGLSYWLDFGALLGATRSGELIPWDRDIDVGVKREDFLPLLARVRSAMQRRGHVMKAGDGCRYIVKHMIKEQVEIRFEIFMFVPTARNQCLVFLRQYGHLATVRAASTSPRQPFPASASPSSAPSAYRQSQSGCDPQLLTRCDLPDYWRYTFPAHYVTRPARVSFEGLQVRVPSPAGEMLRLYRYPYSYWLPLPYRINCYFTHKRYMWLPPVLLLLLAACYVIATRLLAHCSGNGSIGSAGSAGGSVCPGRLRTMLCTGREKS